MVCKIHRKGTLYMIKKKIVTIGIVAVVLAITIPACTYSIRNLQKSEIHMETSSASGDMEKERIKPAEHQVISTTQKAGDKSEKDESVVTENKTEAKKQKTDTSDQIVNVDAKKDAEKKTDAAKKEPSGEANKKESITTVGTDNNTTNQSSAKPAGTTDNKKEEPKPSVPTQQTNPSKPSTPVSTPAPTQAPSKPAHIHTWEAQKKKVHHDPVVSLVWIVDREAYDEPDYVEEYTYDTISKVQCRACGTEYDTYDQWIAHSDNMMDNGDYSHGSYSVVYHQIQTGSQMVPTGTYTHHKEEGHWENQVVKEAYDEETISGYKCSECGAIK